MLTSSRDRTAFLTVLATGLSLGIAIRFWYAAVMPPPPFVLDWTPGIYWLLGLVGSATAFQLTVRNRDRFSAAARMVLCFINGGAFAGFLAVPGILIWRSL
jgi:hypothetical protein